MGFSIATFNTRDFFDDAPPNVVGGLDRGEFGAAEQALATQCYRRKLEAMARVVRRVDADVLALQEVKNARVLDDLRVLLPARNGVPGGGYGPGIVGLPDGRGIACGMLTRLPVLRTTHHFSEELPFPGYVVGDDPAFPMRLRTFRGVLEVALQLPDGEPLVVFVVHLKSRRPTPLLSPDGLPQQPLDHASVAEGEIRSAVARMAEALYVRRLVETRLDAAGDMYVAVAGDFNDDERSIVVRTVTGNAIAGRLVLPGPETATAHFADRALYSCARSVPASARYSSLFGDQAEQLDHVLVSPRLWSRFTGARYFNETLGDDTASLAVPEVYSPESDHAPLRAEFV